MRTYTQTAMIAFLVAISSNASGAQLLIDKECNFVLEVPGLFGMSTHLDYRIQKNRLFNQREDGKFCGRTIASTPFGDADTEECYVVSNSQLISGPHSDKVVSSDCVLSDASRMHNSYAAANFVAYQGDGPANLHGQAFLKTVGGDVKTCAGEDVGLLPATPYVDEVLDKAAAGVLVDLDPGVRALLHKTICDAQGNFSLSHLPAQRWYILTKVTWSVPHIEQPGERPGLISALLFHVPFPPDRDLQGGELLQAAALQPGDNQVFLTDRDRR